MKKLLIAVSAASLIAGQVTAGSFEEPAVEAVEVVEESNSAGWLVPLLAIGLVVLLISQDDDEGCDEDEFRGRNGDCIPLIDAS